VEVIASLRYEKRERLGGIDGQNSEVWRAFDHHLSTELAIKEIAKARLGEADRYFTEARALHASAHPRVVPVCWAGQTPEHVCIAMPLMPGGSLADMIRAKPLRPSQVISIGQDICEGVAQVHLANFTHLDIKPSNVLFDADRRARITDFGLALQLDHLGTADARDLAPYPSFTPPEYITTRARLTAAADVYQIGLTLYRAVNGEPFFAEQWEPVRTLPFAERRDAIACGDFPDRDTFLPGVPLGLRRAIARALARDPALRPVGARQLAEQLAAVDVKHDWEVEEYRPDAVTWRLHTSERADIVVLQRGALPKADVEIWTEGPSGRRRKEPRCWSAAVRTRSQLRQALNRAFRAATT
jgi:serine/threonine protein kinase